MDQLRNAGSCPARLEPSDTEDGTASLAEHPECQFHQDLIDAWLRKAHMVAVDTMPIAAIQR